MALYRNRETGITQRHPKSGIGESLNADEIEDTGLPVKPVVPLGTPKKEVARRGRLANKTTGASRTGKKEGAN